MQKKIIALAIAAAFSAPAFADTTVYGIVDAAIANTSKTGFKSQMNVISGGLSTSRLGVKSVTDLDNGMKAVAVVEFKLDVADAATSVGASRQKMLALAGDFGTVAAGFLQTTGYDFAVKFNPTAGSAVDSYAAANLSGLINTGARAPRAAAYISPNMGGVTVAFNHAFDVGGTGALVANGSTTGNVTTANLLSVTFDQGPLAVGGVYAATANDNTGYKKETDIALGGSYDLGAAKLFATYQTAKNANATATVVDGVDKEFSFAAVAPMGPGALVATIAKNTKGSTTVADNTTAFTVAYLDSLSKTTTAYGAVQQIKLDATPSSITTTVLAVGVRQKF